MINVSGHLRNERRVTGFADDSVSLSVNCCGMQVFKTKDYSQNRFISLFMSTKVPVTIG